LKKEQIGRLDFDSMICSPVAEIAVISKRIAIFLIRTYDEVTLPSIAKKSHAQMLLHKHEIMDTYDEICALKDQIGEKKHPSPTKVVDNKLVI